jgi:dihydrolipoamide dehydrogenase
VLVAIGRRPTTVGFGIDRLGLDESAPLPVGDDGRVATDGSVWAIGDVAGAGQYTHLANHHARVVADHLVGTATRRFDDVVVPRCMFTDPPLIQVGPSWSELRDDADVVHVEVDLGSFPRAMTDELAAGHLWAAARRSTGCLVAAAGAGPGFDELTHALVTAIDGDVPLHRLRRSMQAFPTIGEILGPLYDGLADELSGGD